MPELPEVETVARTLAPQITGLCIQDVHVLHEKSLQAGKELLPLVKGARIVTVFRRAKLLLVGLAPVKESNASGVRVDEFLPPDVSLFMVFHLKMTGRFFVHEPGTPPLKHTRIIFDLVPCPLAADAPEEAPPAGRLFFDDMRTFGYCRIMRPADFADWPFWKTLGPEPLATPAAALGQCLKAKRTSIKAALLDQSVVAGVGNIYADECLFRAGVSPEAKACDITPKRLERLAEALQSVLKQSIEECGSSIRDYRDAKGNAGAFQNNFFVYGRKGETCRTCGRPLASTRVAGRGTVYCPFCQKK